MNEETKIQSQQIADYLFDRLLEHASLSAYCFALIGAFDTTLPTAAR